MRRGAIRIAFGLAAILGVTPGGSRAQLVQTLHRAGDGTVYQVLQHKTTDDNSGTSGVRITSFAAAFGSAIGCPAPGRGIAPLQPAEGLASVFTAVAFDVAQVRKSAIIDEAADAAFNSSGSGTVTIGTHAVSNDGSLALATASTDTPAAFLVDINTSALAPLTLQCGIGGSPSKVTYSFTENPFAQTCTTDPPGAGTVVVTEETTVCVDICDPAPADGYTLSELPVICAGGSNGGNACGICVAGSNAGGACAANDDCPGSVCQGDNATCPGGFCQTGQSIVYAYPVLPSDSFGAAAAGYGIDTDADNLALCGASPGDPLVVVGVGVAQTAPQGVAPEAASPTASGMPTETPTETPTEVPTETPTEPSGGPSEPCHATTGGERAKFVLRNTPDDNHDRLDWTWVRVESTTVADFGDPLTTTSYTLEIIDESGGVPSTVFSATVPPGGTCPGRPCWTTLRYGSGFLYKDSSLAADGIRELRLMAMKNGDGKVSVRGMGANLPLPALPLSQDPRVTVRLSNSLGDCWEAIYTAPARRNNSVWFRDKLP